MDSREEALSALETILYQTGRWDCDFELVHLRAETIRKALQAKDPELVSIDDIIDICSDIEYCRGSDLLKQSCKLLSKNYPNGIIIKGGE